MAADCAAVCTHAAMACVRETVSAAEATAIAGGWAGRSDVVEQQLLGARLVVGEEHFAAALAAVVPCALRGLAVEAPRCSWDDIGGQWAVKRELRVCRFSTTTLSATYCKCAVVGRAKRSNINPSKTCSINSFSVTFWFGKGMLSTVIQSHIAETLGRPSEDVS